MARENRAESSNKLLAKVDFNAPPDRQSINDIRLAINAPTLEAATYGQQSKFYAWKSPKERDMLMNSTSAEIKEEHRLKRERDAKLSEKYAGQEENRRKRMQGASRSRAIDVGTLLISQC